MIAEKASFGRYGKTFQEGLVQLIFEDRPFADQITEVLDSNFLELEYLRVFLQKVTTYRTKNGKHPSVEAFIAILRTELDNEDEVVQKQVRDYFVRTTIDDKVDDSEYIKSKALDFCKKQVLKLIKGLVDKKLAKEVKYPEPEMELLEPEPELEKEEKIGAIGLRVKNWVTYHGLSFNIDPDLEYYKNKIVYYYWAVYIF